MERETVLRAIDKAYAARIEGDKAALAQMCAPDARLELAGEKALIAGYAAGPAGFAETAARLVDLVRFDRVERRDALVEGNRAAVHWRATVSVAGGEPFQTETFDLWEVDADGRIVSLLQFVDTARFAQKLALVRDDAMGVNPA